MKFAHGAPTKPIRIHLRGPNIARILAISPDQTFARLSEMATSFPNSIPKDLFGLTFFFTWDRQGKRAVAKLEAKVGSVITSEAKIHITYFRFHDNPWQPIAEIHTFFNCFICSRCVVTETHYPIKHFNGVVSCCSKCLRKIQDFSVFRCLDCGVGGCKANLESKEGSYFAVCNDKNCSPKVWLKECATCGLPLMQPKKCGKCGQVMYCGPDCQRQDWPSHKLVCGSTSGVNDKDP